jgi:hypothetical protein
MRYQSSAAVRTITWLAEEVRDIPRFLIAGWG